MERGRRVAAVCDAVLRALGEDARADELRGAAVGSAGAMETDVEERRS